MLAISLNPISWVTDAASAVVGGAAIYDVFMDRAERIELTEILATVEGDVFMDDLRANERWQEVSCEEHRPEGDLPGYRYVTLERAS